MGALMVAEGENGAVLIVATDRDDRRYLFDALDAQEFDAIYTAVEELTGLGHQVALLTDLGSADMTVEAVLEMVDGHDVRHCHGPLVEGAVSAAVTAQVGGDLDAVAEAARARDLFA